MTDCGEKLLYEQQYIFFFIVICLFASRIAVNPGIKLLISTYTKLLIQKPLTAVNHVADTATPKTMKNVRPEAYPDP